MYVYGGVPPEGLVVIEPVDEPLQAILKPPITVGLFKFPLSMSGCVNVKDPVLVHPLLSVTVTV